MALKYAEKNQSQHHMSTTDPKQTGLVSNLSPYSNKCQDILLTVTKFVR
jgi:hypothetical protein